MKAAQEYLWPTAQHPLASFSLVTLMTYHGGCILAYLPFFYLTIFLPPRGRRAEGQGEGQDGVAG